MQHGWKDENLNPKEDTFCFADEDFAARAGESEPDLWLPGALQAAEDFLGDFDAKEREINLDRTVIPADAKTSAERLKVPVFSETF